MRKSILDQGKSERSVLGECKKIIVFQNQNQSSGMLIVKNPRCWILIFLIEKNGEISINLEQKQFPLKITDAIHANFQGADYLLCSTKKGGVKVSGRSNFYESSSVVEGTSKKISKISFINLKSKFALLMQEESGNVWKVEGTTLQSYEDLNRELLVEKIILMESSSSGNQCVLLDQKGRIHLVQEDNQKLKHQIFEMDKNYSQLQQKDQPLLGEVSHFDYVLSSEKLIVYLANQIDLFSVECSLNDNSFTFKVNQIFGIDTTQGQVNKVIAYGNDRPYFEYEIGLVQDFKISALSITNKLQSIEIWKSDKSQERPAQAKEYEYRKLAGKYVHMVHHIPESNSEMKKQHNCDYDYTAAKLKAFYFSDQ